MQAMQPPIILTFSQNDRKNASLLRTTPQGSVAAYLIQTPEKSKTTTIFRNSTGSPPEIVGLLEYHSLGDDLCQLHGKSTTVQDMFPKTAMGLGE